MAQILPGPLVSDIAGTVLGSTFQRGASGLQVRGKPRPRLRRTAATNPLRASIEYLSRLWATLTPTERTAWQASANSIVWTNRFGVVIPGFGYWAYLRANLALLRCAQPVFTTGGDTSTVPPLTSLTPTLAASTSVRLAWSSPIGADPGTVLELHASPPVSGGRSVTSAPMRIIARWTLADANPQILTADYLAAFGLLGVAGQQSFFAGRCVKLSTGNTSTLLQAQAYWL